MVSEPLGNLVGTWNEVPPKLRIVQPGDDRLYDLRPTQTEAAVPAR